MGKMQKIKLAVADRFYPLIIDPEQEESFRRAAKKINDMIIDFQLTYELRDKQDGLAMCAIILAQQIEQPLLEGQQQDAELQQRLENLYHLLDSIV